MAAVALTLGGGRLLADALSQLVCQPELHADERLPALLRQLAPRFGPRQHVAHAALGQAQHLGTAQGYTRGAAAIVPTERDRAPWPPGDRLGLGWALRTQHPPRGPTGAQRGPWQEVLEDINHPRALKGRLPTPKRGHQTPFPRLLPSLRRSSGRCRSWPTSP